MSEKLQKKARIGIITASDRASRGEYEDISGKAIIDVLNSYLTSPWELVYRCISDDRDVIEDTLKDLYLNLEPDKPYIPKFSDIDDEKFKQQIRENLEIAINNFEKENS